MFFEDVMVGLLRLVFQQIEDGFVKNAVGFLLDGDEKQIEFSQPRVAEAVDLLRENACSFTEE